MAYLKQVWIAADILRGSLDPADYRQRYILLLLKRLNDILKRMQRIIT